MRGRSLRLLQDALRVVGVAALTACGAGGEDLDVDDGATPTESGTADAGTETSGDGDGDGDGDGEEPARPTIPQPPEAEDLNADPGIVEVTLVADETTISVDGETYEAYAYNGSVPGPTIRARVGDLLRVTLDNRLEFPSTIHWHGISTPWEMDGATWKLSPVGPGETFVYEFTLEQPGTFWYHPHFDTARQVDLGLYGAVVVSTPDEPAVDHDLVFLVDSWGEHGDAEGHGLHGTDLTWTVNGALDGILELVGGASTRLRMIDVANGGYLELDWPGARQIGGGQGLLSAPRPSPEVLIPGDRTELEIEAFEPVVGAEVVDVLARPRSPYGLSEAEPERRLMSVAWTDGEPVAPAWPFSGEEPTPDPGYLDIVYSLQGDATTDTWTINGEVFPDVTPYVVAQDSWQIVEVRNISSSDHPFHLHGHVLEVLSVDGVPPASRTLVDTYNVPIASVVRFGLLADNPGEWMTHCHILPHAKGGMMTILDVSP